MSDGYPPTKLEEYLETAASGSNASGAVDRRRSPTKAKKKSPSPTKKQSPVRKVERQIASGKGPDTIAGSNTYKALCAVCKKWGLPTGTIAQKADMATALIVEQWKKMTAAA